MSLALRAATTAPVRLRRSKLFRLSLSAPRSLSSTPSTEHALPSAVHPVVLNSVPPSGPTSSRDSDSELSGQEWEIRTGRAIYILQQTLPTFFTTGLISSVDTSPTGKDEDEPSIYSPNIRLEYHPPSPLPSPFPRTLHVEGLHLYLGSSVFIRHTMNALYTDLRVELRTVRVQGPPSSTGAPCSNSPPDNSAMQSQQQGKDKPQGLRDKSLFIGLTAHGINRVSKAESGWDVNSTYTFSPTSGLIHRHNIDSILPEPHQAFFSALQAALSKIGLGGSQGAAGAGGVAPTSSPNHCPR